MMAYTHKQIVTHLANCLEHAGGFHQRPCPVCYVVLNRSQTDPHGVLDLIREAHRTIRPQHVPPATPERV